MTAKQELVLRTAQQIKDQTQNPHKNGTNKKQWMNNNRSTTLNVTGVKLLDFFYSGMQLYVLLSPDLYAHGDDTSIS